MDFDKQPIGAGGKRCFRHRRYQAAPSRTVRRIRNHRQVRQLFHKCHGGKIERVASLGFKRLDSALTEHNAMIAAVQQVLRRKQPFLDRRPRAALEK
jgi:hypothetical protein